MKKRQLQSWEGDLLELRAGLNWQVRLSMLASDNKTRHLNSSFAAAVALTQHYKQQQAAGPYVNLSS